MQHPEPETEHAAVEGSFLRVQLFNVSIYTHTSQTKPWMMLDKHFKIRLATKKHFRTQENKLLETKTSSTILLWPKYKHQHSATKPDTEGF